MSKIGVDIDEILSETMRTFLSFYNDEHATHVTFDEITNYSFGKQFGISSEDEKRAVIEFFFSDMAKDIPTLEGSVNAINLLAKENELYAISSRPMQLMDITKTWLDRHYPNCFKEIILTDSHFDSTKTKSGVCKNLSLDIFIDDQIVFAEDCAPVCSKVFLMDKPWNVGSLEGGNIVRVASWAEITQWI